MRGLGREEKKVETWYCVRVQSPNDVIQKIEKILNNREKCDVTLPW